MGTNFIRAMLLTSASVAMVATAAPTAAYAQEASYQIDIPAQGMGDALRALGKATKQNIVFNGSLVKGKRSAAVKGRMSASEALGQMLAGSGLKMSRGSGGGFVVQAGNAVPAPTNAPERVRASQSQGRGTITGTVRDQVSGASLKGALVELVGTGRSTSTDDLGEFRFANAPTGNVTVRISYLGYAEQQSTIAVGDGETYAEEFTLVGGSGGQEIVVYGSRSARAQALNQERTAENVSTVISGDLLGDFSGTTLSESLRRAPGVIFERDPLTGDGANIAVRGLAPDYNAVKFNGIELPESSGVGRSASLGNILTESISKVTISKTLLPNQDSSGTGGLVEIETKTPLDRPKRYFSATLEGANRNNDFNQELLAAGTASMRFGSNDQFGVSASVQYRERDIKRVGYNARLLYGQFYPLQVDGTPISNSQFIDPRTPFPYEPEADGVYPSFLFIDRDNTETSNLGVTLSAAAELGTHTKLFFDYQKLKQDDTSFQQSWVLNPSVSYALTPINALGGEERYALSWNGVAQARTISEFAPIKKNNSDIFTFRGETNIDKLSLKYSAGYTSGKSHRVSYNIASTYLLFLDQYTLPEAFDATEGRVIWPFAPRAPGSSEFFNPLISQAGYDVLNNPENYYVDSIFYSDVNGYNSRYNGEVSARYDFDNSVLRYVEIGGSHKSSKFRDRSDRSRTYDFINYLTVSSLDLDFQNESLSDVGIDSRILFPSTQSVQQFFLSELPRISADCDPYSVEGCPTNVLFARAPAGDERLGGEFTKEAETAFWLQSRIDLGKLEIIGGARVSKIKIDAVNLVRPSVFNENFALDVAFRDANTVVTPETAKQTVVLPRVLANYRFNDSLIVRAGYYLAVARPQINLLSRTPVITLIQAPFFGPNSNQPILNVTKGNPDLKSARTHNFDFSAEYYDKDIGVIKVGAFYKRINNLLESNIATGIGSLGDVVSLLPDDPRFQDVIDNPDDYAIAVGTPFNNEDPAHIWGIETSVERQFTFLPGALSGLGIYANYTYTDSSKNQPMNWQNSPVVNSAGVVIGYETVNYTVPDVPFNGQAKHSGTIGLTYNKYGIDANIAYTGQSRRQLSFDNYNLSRFEEAYSTLDARIEYRFRIGKGDISIYAEGNDLLRGPHDASLKTTVGADDGQTPKYFDSARYFGGRQLRAGIRASF